MLLKDKYIYAGLLIVICLSGVIFYDSFYFQVWQAHNLHWVSDASIHAQIVETSQSHGNFPMYSIWYRLVNLASGFSRDYKNIAYTSIVLLTFFVALKYVITYLILRLNHVKITSTLLVTLSLVLLMPILSYYTVEPDSGILFISRFHVYLGNISPNQWHNSTLIFAMPFNLLLFYFSVKHAESNRLRDFLIMGILSIISLLCKPNYGLAFLPVFCVYILLLNYKKKTVLIGVVKTSLIAVPSILTLLVQWHFTFVDNDLFLHATKTVFAPFLVWKAYTPHIFISLLLSIAFPLITRILYFNKTDIYLFISWLVFIFALLMFSLLAEYPGYNGGNYEWGAIAANYILFLFSARLLLQQPVDWKYKIAFVVFGLHVLSGLFFLGYFLIYQMSLIF